MGFRENLSATVFMSMVHGALPLNGKPVMHLRLTLNNIIEVKEYGRIFS